MKDFIINEIDKMKDKLWEISDYMYHNPELGDEEYNSSKLLKDLLEEYGFTVESGIIDRPTAFKAVYDSKIPGPSVAYLCEYDALPEVGHGCGHNIIGTMSAGAAIALRRIVEKIGGKIVVLGTPAEETNGAKVGMAEKGVFNGIDAALILHPDNYTYESGSSLAMEAIQFSFKGKACHAASEPELGINALDAVILTFNGINALRQHVTTDVRIHGVIKEGGVAANIVPDKAVAQFYIRAAKKNYLQEVVEKVKNIARGAELMTGAELVISNYELPYDNLNTNIALSKAFTQNLNYVGILDVLPSKKSFGSLDMGNVSNVIPAIHPYIGLNNPSVVGHSKEMADSTITDKAHERLLKGSSALALTGYDIITDKELLEKIKNEFEKSSCL